MSSRRGCPVGERPILMATDLVRQVLAGRKTQTRRPLKVQPPDWVHPTLVNRTEVQHLFQWTEPEQVPPRKLRRWPEDGYMRSPYSFPTMRLWVREAFGHHVTGDGFGRAGHAQLVHRADVPEERAHRVKWKPSIHMPRSACRLVLQIADVRAQRLQQITEADALAEGCRSTREYVANGVDWESARTGFHLLWDRLYGKDPVLCWNANPWVWAITFRPVSP